MSQVTENEARYVPTRCPSCSADLIWSDTHVDLLCENPECPAQFLNKLEHFCRCLGIEEMSTVTLEKLELTCIEDLYNLDDEWVVMQPGFGARKAAIIMTQIENSLLDVMPAKLIEAFGIPGVGEKTAEAIVRILPGNSAEEKMRCFFSINRDELLFVDGIGGKVASNILAAMPANESLYEFMLASGLTFKESTNVSNKLNGVKVAMTGSSPDGRKRAELEQILKSHGAIVGSVSRNTDILVAEDPNGGSGKLQNARKYGTKIVSYDEFFKDL